MCQWQVRAKSKSRVTSDIDLVNDVEELEEDGSESTGEAGLCLAAAVCEAMAERQPLLLHERSEALHRAVVRIQQYLYHTQYLHNTNRTCITIMLSTKVVSSD